MALISGAFITRLGPSLSLQRCESSLEGSWSVYFALMLVWQSNKHGALWVTRVAFISPSLAIRSKPFTKEMDLWHRKRKVVFLFVRLRCSGRFGNSSSWRGNGKHRKTDIVRGFVHKSEKVVHLQLCVLVAALWTRLLTADRGAGWSLWRLQRREREWPGHYSATTNNSPQDKESFVTRAALTNSTHCVIKLADTLLPLCDTESVESPRGKPAGESPLSDKHRNGYSQEGAFNHEQAALRFCNFYSCGFYYLDNNYPVSTWIRQKIKDVLEFNNSFYCLKWHQRTKKVKYTATLIV